MDFEKIVASLIIDFFPAQELPSSITVAFPKCLTMEVGFSLRLDRFACVLFGVQRKESKCALCPLRANSCTLYFYSAMSIHKMQKSKVINALDFRCRVSPPVQVSVL